MRGYPKTLQTREDYEYVLANFTKDQYLQDFKDLLISRFDYIYQHNMADDEVVSDDIPHKILSQTDEKGNYVRQLYYRVEVPTAKIFQLGYTVEEVEKIINS